MKKVPCTEAILKYLSVRSTPATAEQIVKVVSKRTKYRLADTSILRYIGFLKYDGLIENVSKTKGRGAIGLYKV